MEGRGGWTEGRGGCAAAYLHVDVGLFDKGAVRKQGAGKGNLGEAHAHEVLGEGQALCGCVGVGVRQGTIRQRSHVTRADSPGRP